MIDTLFVEVPKQQDTKDKNKKIKEGRLSEDWGGTNPPCSPKRTPIPCRRRRIRPITYDYKDHVKVNARIKLIKNYAVTDAFINDLQTVDDLTNKADTDREFYADSICTDKPIEDILTGKGIISCINKKGCRNKALTEEQKQNDRIKSKIRARIGHIFGFIKNNMGGFFIRTKGKRKPCH
ncbi:MAG: transposase [Dissulfurimicrobium sp.]|uniref:transposase n=1 Tax=Dissulfurimicrobium sp. TaxID=2022436 RepID=UPI0040496397